MPASALASAQHPAASAHPHPAIRAQARATEARADAARMESCAQQSRHFLEQLAQGNYRTATANFSPRMHKMLDAGQLTKAWQSLAAQLGPLDSRGTPRRFMFEGMPVVATPLHFRNGGLMVQLACNTGGRFTGFQLRPLPSTAPAPAASPR